MNTDSVSAAFDLILEEIGTVVSEVHSQGVAFLSNGQYQEAENVISSAKELSKFREKLDSLKREWRVGLDATTRAKVSVEASKVSHTIASHSKSPKTALQVKFPDGTTLFKDSAAKTFTATIQKLGPERVAALGLKLYGDPLLSRRKVPNYTSTQVDGYWVMTHSSTVDKRKQLLDIAAGLNVELTVDVVPPH
jgi:hypothetical protein